MRGLIVGERHSNSCALSRRFSRAAQCIAHCQCSNGMVGDDAALVEK